MILNIQYFKAFIVTTKTNKQIVIMKMLRYNNFKRYTSGRNLYQAAAPSCI